MKLAATLTIALLTLAAIAAPTMADPDHEDRDAKKAERDEHREARQDAAQQKKDAREERQAHHQAMKDERKNATLAKAHERCDAYEERTGRDLPACDRLDQVHDDSKQARRAAHALFKAIDALEHRIVTLEKLEVKFMEKLEGDNLTANQTAAYEAKIIRIQAAQNKTLDKIEKMEDRLEKLTTKWDKVRDHIDRKAKVAVCHQGEDGNKTIVIGRSAWPAHERHNDTRGPCEDAEAEAEVALDSEHDDGAKDAEEGEESQDDPAAGS